jgi:hypothetical protein
LPAVQAGLVDFGGEAVSAVAEGELDAAEELLLGEVEEFAGHVEGGLFEGRAEALEEGVEAGLAFGGVGGGLIRGVGQHGCSPAVRTRV